MTAVRVVATTLGVALGVPTGAGASPRPEVIVLPGASSAEGIATGQGSTFYAGDLLSGDIFRGDLQRGTAELFIDAPSGRMAVGMKVDVSRGLLFVAGGATGQAYVYDTGTGATTAVHQLASAGASFVNDVALTRTGGWFTDSAHAQLHFVPTDPSAPARTLTLSGPAADTSSEFNLNGIAATPDGSALVVAHSGNGELYGVDPATGASWVIGGVSVPTVDGILLEAGHLWAVQNLRNQVSRIRLSPDLASGTVEEVVTSSSFQVPTTVARFGDRLALVNAKFDTGFPPTANQYEVVIVGR